MKKIRILGYNFFTINSFIIVMLKLFSAHVCLILIFICLTSTDETWSKQTPEAESNLWKCREKSGNCQVDKGTSCRPISELSRFICSQKNKTMEFFLNEQNFHWIRRIQGIWWNTEAWNRLNLKIPSHLYLPDALVVSWSLTQEAAGLNPFTVMTNYFLSLNSAKTFRKNSNMSCCLNSLLMALLTKQLG